MNDYLHPDERTRLDQLRRTDGFTRDVLGHTERVLASRPFARVKQRGRDFLRYVVAKTLLGEADELKEVTVAIAVFEEDASFNPAESSKVRTAAADLREHLDVYAKGDGRHDKIRIIIPLNTYAPEISDQRASVAVVPFENWHPQGEQGHVCATIAAEIAYRLEAYGLRVIVGEAPTGPVRRLFILRGAVEPQEDTLRLSVSLAAPETKRILVSRTFEGTREDVLRIARDVAQTLQATLELGERVPATAQLKASQRLRARAKSA